MSYIDFMDNWMRLGTELIVLAALAAVLGVAVAAKMIPAKVALWIWTAPAALVSVFVLLGSGLYLAQQLGIGKGWGFPMGFALIFGVIKALTTAAEFSAKPAPQRS